MTMSKRSGLQCAPSKKHQAFHGPCTSCRRVRWRFPVVSCPYCRLTKLAAAAAAAVVAGAGAGAPARAVAVPVSAAAAAAAAAAVVVYY